MDLESKIETAVRQARGNILHLPPTGLVHVDCHCWRWTERWLLKFSGVLDAYIMYVVVACVIDVDVRYQFCIIFFS